MFQLYAESERGQKQELTNNPAYEIQSIDGLDPPDAVLNLYKVAGVDGTSFNSATLANRQITLTIAINHPAEENRNALYRYFQTKRSARLYFSDELKEVYIDGYVQNITIPFFGKKQLFQVTMICNDPYFHYAIPLEYSFGDGVNPGFEFPFEIPAGGIEFSTLESGSVFEVNNPAGECGIVIRFMASGSVSNPRVYNGDTDEFIGVTTTMQSGDEIVINTRTGAKSIKRIRGASVTNMISYKMSGSSWIRLLPGENTFSLSASSGSSNLICIIQIEGEIEGV